MISNFSLNDVHRPGKFKTGRNCVSIARPGPAVQHVCPISTWTSTPLLFDDKTNSEVLKNAKCDTEAFQVKS